MGKTLTKQAFADIVKTSRPTLNKWIKQNKDGIAQYAGDDGIDAAIFETDLWKHYKPASPDLSAGMDELQAALDETTQKLEAAIKERDELNAEILTLKNEISVLNARIEYKDQEIQFQKDVAEEMRRIAADFKQMADQAQRLQMAQLAALPAPRKHRTPIEFLKDVFGSKKADETDEEYSPPN